jgi:hypothetical protein
LKNADGIILVALNIHPGASAIINPLCSSGSIAIPPDTSEIIKPTSLVMGEVSGHVHFPNTNIIVFTLLFIL